MMSAMQIIIKKWPVVIVSASAQWPVCPAVPAGKCSSSEMPKFQRLASGQKQLKEKWKRSYFLNQDGCTRGKVSFQSLHFGQKAPPVNQNGL